jgi:DNA-binding transcriptional LysR family regulator
MAFTDASLTALRVFREVAERGTLTAAATALGYTHSAVSRQIAALESNAWPVPGSPGCPALSISQGW